MRARRKWGSDITLQHKCDYAFQFNVACVIIIVYNLDATDYGDRLKARALIQYVDSRVDIDIHPNTTDYFWNFN